MGLCEYSCSNKNSLGYCKTTGCINLKYSQKHEHWNLQYVAGEHGRLIDADALLASLEVDPIECPGCPEPEYLAEFRELLESAPTVLGRTKGYDR